jgi:hypothetical protein
LFPDTPGRRQGSSKFGIRFQSEMNDDGNCACMKMENNGEEKNK